MRLGLMTDTRHTTRPQASAFWGRPRSASFSQSIVFGKGARCRGCERSTFASSSACRYGGRDRGDGGVTWFRGRNIWLVGMKDFRQERLEIAEGCVRILYSFILRDIKIRISDKCG